MSSGITNVSARVRKSMPAPAGNSSFESWADVYKLASRSLIGISNSFFFRDQLKKAKTTYFLTLKPTGDGSTIEPVPITQPL